MTLNLEEIDSVIEDLLSYRRKENFTELYNSANDLKELLYDHYHKSDA
jgi:hypothetical protein